jgi:hypothetical protein
MLCLAVEYKNKFFRSKKSANVMQPRFQGCQTVCFLTKNPNLGKFWKAVDWKILIHFMTIWNILPTFGIFYDHSVHFVFI